MPPPLPLLKILKDTFQFVWDKKLRFLRALLIPALAIFALDYLPDLVQMVEESFNSPKTKETTIECALKQPGKGFNQDHPTTGCTHEPPWDNSNPDNIVQLCVRGEDSLTITQLNKPLVMCTKEKLGKNFRQNEVLEKCVEEQLGISTSLHYISIECTRGQSSENFIPDDALIGWLIILIQWAPYVLFAITCHRLALMEDSGVPAYGMLKWTRRESQFMGWILVLLIVYIASYCLIYIPFSKIFGESSEGITVNMILESPLEYVSYVLALYICTRLSLLYPATALDQQVSLKWAWALSRNNGWRLTLLMGGLPLILGEFESIVWREGATWIEHGFYQLMYFALLAIEIVALSFSYKFLMENGALGAEEEAS